MKNQQVVIILGPTAVGKTETSIQLAKKLNGEIINGDALQVYQDLTIGTAKISESEMEGVPHHLLSILPPDASFSVAEYQLLVRQKIEEISARGRVPILVGGTGLYIQSVLYDFRFETSPQDVELRKRLELQTDQQLWEQLNQLDSEAAKEIPYQNKQRIIRALERVLTSGKTKLQQQQDVGTTPYYNFYIVGLNRDRTQLYDRINQRVNVMLKNGLVTEVKGLLHTVSKDAQSLKAIGYKEVVEAIEKNWSSEQLTETIQQNTRRYAKRQLTYFRNKLPVNWYDPQQDYQKIEQDCCSFLKGND